MRSGQEQQGQERYYPYLVVKEIYSALLSTTHSSKSLP